MNDTKYIFIIFVISFNLLYLIYINSYYKLIVLN